jgi:hypothetical protein
VTTKGYVVILGKRPGAFAAVPLLACLKPGGTLRFVAWEASQAVGANGTQVEAEDAAKLVVSSEMAEKTVM